MKLIPSLPPRGLLVLGLVTCLSLYTSALLRSLPLLNQLKQCYQLAQNYSTQNYVGSMYCWFCESPLRAQIKGAPAPIDPQKASYFNSLYTHHVEPYLGRGGRVRRQATQCVRKEYRTLSDDERRRFHDAVNTLKRDTTVEPNKYDALALLHTGLATFMAHGGPGFLGWHRVYLLLFEAALKEVDPSVCLPYWNSALDEGLQNPAQSHIFSTDFIGDGDDAVDAGPFAGWITPAGVPLRRSVGRDGQLFTRQAIENIMSRDTHADIALPGVDPQYDLEFHHGGVHIYIGGDMAMLDTAANDPVFFLHHAFVDYIWEMFRMRMRNRGLNPEVYPVGEVNDFHLGTAMMGFGNLTHADGYLDDLTASYAYAPSPECSASQPDCGTKYLSCDVTRARCLPIVPSNPPNNPVGPLPQPCPAPKPQGYQNSFCMDGTCDMSKWVWIPVKIVSKRPPEFKRYHSYPVMNGAISRTSDIYEPSSYMDASRYVSQSEGHPKRYEKCSVDDGVGRIFVSSTGVDYDGAYKESSIIDQRLASSVSVTYIAVKDPAIGGVSKALLRAHDSCGRVCSTACRVPNSNPARYEPCSGIVEITPEQPLGYGATYASAMLNVFDYASNGVCPSVILDSFVAFYCDYIDHLPWVDKPSSAYVPPTVPVPPPAPGAGKCQLSPQCTIDGPCMKGANTHQCSKYYEMRPCDGSCSSYAVCIYGVYWPRTCPLGTRFDARQSRCVPGKCLTGSDVRSGSPMVGSDYAGRLISSYNIRGRVN